MKACVVEQLPNFNDALRFANRHDGRVFLCDSYSEIDDARFRIPILKDMVFEHLMKVALVTELTPSGKLRRMVKKIGIDPHAAFANMLCDIAWARAHGTALFLMDDGAPEHPTVPNQHPVARLIRHHQSQGACGGCTNLKVQDGVPGENGMGICAFLSKPMGECSVRDVDPVNGCPGHDPRVG